ncbi:hypothetical protein PN498_28355 [Oscillatoria sp. CS-180]|uniref:hypothetical protein n=1 Tax=Oscillatoria sp. CS-180 TaxID=3021720 RepID=UPI00232CD46A|nr:hypothetical protein [Oscillatoria sp. CS-180]MDB9529932.1 hypothetical protein [Oscillatoria sp. CS-180]
MAETFDEFEARFLQKLEAAEAEFRAEHSAAVEEIEAEIAETQRLIDQRDRRIEAIRVRNQLSDAERTMKRLNSPRVGRIVISGFDPELW